MAKDNTDDLRLRKSQVNYDTLVQVFIRIHTNTHIKHCVHIWQCKVFMELPSLSTFFQIGSFAVPQPSTLYVHHSLLSRQVIKSGRIDLKDIGKKGKEDRKQAAT